MNAARYLLVVLPLLCACGGSEENDADSGPNYDGASTADASTADAATTDFTPYFADNFDSYSPGEPLTGGNPFGTAGRTVATTEQAFSGATSARMEIREGDGGGFGQWGGSVELRPKLAKGQEVWVRLRVYWPSSFQFTATPRMKFLRVHNENEDGGNGGYNDLYINADTSMQCIKERHDIWAYEEGSLPLDTWQSYEMYLYADDITVDGGGGARMRIWKDNTLIFDRTDVPTLFSPEGNLDLFYLFTYWNNENPPNNHVFVDDLIIATSVSMPPNVDSAGNSMIGDWSP